MYECLEGKNHEQKPLQVLWELVAFDNKGPNIPCLAAAVLIRKLKEGKLEMRGAMSSMRLLTLTEYFHKLKSLPIKIDVYQQVGN